MASLPRGLELGDRPSAPYLAAVSLPGNTPPTLSEHRSCPSRDIARSPFFGGVSLNLACGARCLGGVSGLRLAQPWLTLRRCQLKMTACATSPIPHPRVPPAAAQAAVHPTAGCRRPSPRRRQGAAPAGPDGGDRRRSSPRADRAPLAAHGAAEEGRGRILRAAPRSRRWTRCQTATSGISPR